MILLFASCVAATVFFATLIVVLLLGKGIGESTRRED